MTTLWIDFETRSLCDLPVHGAYNYSRDPSTRILCMGYAFDNDDVEVWLPSQPFPAHIVDHFAYGGQIRAHNAAFDRLITEYVLCPDFGVPTPKLSQWYCTAAQARANCYPGSLEDVGRFAGAGMKKDHRGSYLIRQLSLPRHDGTFNEDPELMAEMISYCCQDIRAMREVSSLMRPLSPTELLDYHINEMINDRGVKVDVPLAEAALKYANEELVEIQDLVREITEGVITSVRSPKMRQWVLDRVGSQALKLMTVYKDGEKKFSIDKNVRANLLILADDDHEEVPPDVADVIQCADDLWASSVAKFKRLVELSDVEDYRVRGAFVFNGGSATGRASSYGVQVHNFTRKCAKRPEDVRSSMVRGEAIVPNYGKRVTDVLKGMLRPALIPESGNVFVVADWSGIEARANPWGSAQTTAEDVLDVFRSGRDIYIREAAGIFNRPEQEILDEYLETEQSEERQIGKVAILSCGFGGGIGAFAAMGRNYGIILPESDARKTVNAWRRANPWAVNYWQDLEEAYTRALRNPNTEFSAGRVTYFYDGQHLWYALPSGRILNYPYAKLEAEGVTYAKAAWKPAADATEWPRARLWKGLACENITQAISNDLLRNSLRQMTDEDMNIVLHVHDEIVVECRENEADDVKKRMTEIMCTAPSWAVGIPLDVGIKTMSRYGK